MGTVRLKIEKEYAEELVETIERVLAFDDKNDFLCTDDYNTLDELKDTLLLKLGRVL